MPLTPLHQMAAHFGVPISQQSLQPFLDAAKDRNRTMMLRMTAGPVGAAAAHMAPIVPESLHGIAGAGSVPLTRAIPQMLGMANSAVGSGAGAGILEHLGPLLGMGSLGAGAAMLTALGVSKGYKALKNWNQRRKAKSAFGLPKFGSIIEENPQRGTAMFNDVRFIKFAAAGALGYDAPSNLRELAEKVAFTLGFMKAVTNDQEQFSLSEQQILADLNDAVKTAGSLVKRIRNMVRVKTASTGSYQFDRAALVKECQAGTRLQNGVVKTAAVKTATSLGSTVFDNSSKVAKAIETLGVDGPTLQMLCGGKQTSGVATGVLSLFAA